MTLKFKPFNEQLNLNYMDKLPNFTHDLSNVDECNIDKESQLMEKFYQDNISCFSMDN